MFQDKHMEGRFTAYRSAVVILTNGVQWLLQDVYMEAIARFDEYYTPVGDYSGFWSCDEEPINETNIIGAEHDLYDIKEVLKIVSVEGWQLQDEWEYDPFEDCEAV